MENWGDDPRTDDPVLLGQLEDLRGGIEVLSSTSEGKHREAARKICELSRDIRFRLGPPKLAHPDLVRLIVQLLMDAKTRIRSDGDGQIEAYRENIGQRAELLLKGLATGPALATP